MKYVKWIDLTEEKDVDRILIEVSSGNIVIFSMAKLIGEQKWKVLSKYIMRINQECKTRGFDVSALGTFRGLVTPSEWRIWQNNMSDTRNLRRNKANIPYVA